MTFQSDERAPDILDLDDKPVRMVSVGASGYRFPLAERIAVVDGFYFTSGIFHDLGDQARVIMTVVGTLKDSDEAVAFSGIFDHMTAMQSAARMTRMAANIPLSRR